MSEFIGNCPVCDGEIYDKHKISGYEFIFECPDCYQSVHIEEIEG